MAQKQISRFPLNEKILGLSGHVPNYAFNFVYLVIIILGKNNILSFTRMGTTSRPNPTEDAAAH